MTVRNNPASTEPKEPQAMTVRFENSEYFRSHFRTPRGRGSWAFSKSAKADVSEMFFSSSMSFSEAKAWVRKQEWATSDPDATVFVQP